MRPGRSLSHFPRLRTGAAPDPLPTSRAVMASRGLGTEPSYTQSPYNTLRLFCHSSAALRLQGPRESALPLPAPTTYTQSFPGRRLRPLLPHSVLPRLPAPVPDTVTRWPWGTSTPTHSTISAFSPPGWTRKGGNSVNRSSDARPALPARLSAEHDDSRGANHHPDSEGRRARRGTPSPSAEVGGVQRPHV